MHYAVFGFFQLSITCLRSTYAIGIGSMYCWLLLLNCIPSVGMYHDLFIHSPGDGHSFTGFFFSSHEQSFCENSHTCLCDHMVLFLSDKHPEVGMLGNCIRGFKRTCQAGFQRGCTSLHSYQQWTRVLGAPRPCQQLTLSIFLQI